MEKEMAPPVTWVRLLGTAISTTAIAISSSLERRCRYVSIASRLYSWMAATAREPRVAHCRLCRCPARAQSETLLIVACETAEGDCRPGAIAVTEVLASGPEPSSI